MEKYEEMVRDEAIVFGEMEDEVLGDDLVDLEDDEDDFGSTLGAEDDELDEEVDEFALNFERDDI